MKTFFVFAGALAVAVSGCAESKGDGVIDTTFDACQPLLLDAQDGSAKEKLSIAEAAQLWNDIAGTQLTVDPAAFADERAADAVVPVFFDKAGAAYHGQYDDKEGVIYVNDDIESDHARAVTLAHEVGHAFGLFHVDVDDDVSVMNNGNLVTEPNGFDVDNVQKLWGACAAPQ